METEAGRAPRTIVTEADARWWIRHHIAECQERVCDQPHRVLALIDDELGAREQAAAKATADLRAELAGRVRAEIKSYDHLSVDYQNGLHTGLAMAAVIIEEKL